METNSMVSNEEEQMELPPGFRFYPTDEELITHYLSHKVVDNNFCARAIGEVDLNKCEPWDLPWRAKMGEKEWYFFCVRDRKYPTGLRTNRATEAGYWKATGKDKEIHRAKTLVGMKKTLVFYRGRAPKGEKTNWVMHEYRLEGKYSFYNLPKAPKNEWVICRIFQKTAAGKKVHISGLAIMNHPDGNESKQAPLPSSTSTSTSLLPPLMDSSPKTSETRTNQPDTCHVSCFSNPMERGDHKSQEHMLYNTNNCFKYTSPISSHNNSNISPVYLNSAPQIPTSTVGNIQFRDSFLMSDQSLLRLLLENQAPNMKRIDTSSRLTNEEMFQVPFEDQVDPSISAAPIDLDCVWNYSM